MEVFTWGIILGDDPSTRPVALVRQQGSRFLPCNFPLVTTGTNHLKSLRFEGLREASG
jgi:hypothetical protein